MSASRRVLVLGAGGMLGSHVVRVMRRHSAQFEGITQIHERFETNVAVHDYLETYSPGSVINCIGYAGTDSAEHFRVNGCLPRAIADWCEQRGALFIHISTNSVFAPDVCRRWLPSDPLSPSTPYEISKAFGEDPRAYVIRASFIGWSSKGNGILNCLHAGKPYMNRLWNGVTAWTLAMGLADVVANHHRSPQHTIQHVHSPDVISFRDLATLLGSASICTGESGDGRLLGGGADLPSIREQVREYLSLDCHLGSIDP